MESPAMLAPTPNVVETTTPIPFVHRHYILLKAHYFLFFSAFGMIYPILNVTLRSRGLTDTEISYINLIIPFLIFFTNPLMGFTADHTRRYLLVFNLILAITTILYGLMFMVPNIKTHNIEAKIFYNDQLGRVLDFCANQEVAIKCSSRSTCGCSYQAYCQTDNLKFNFTFSMNSNHSRQKINSPINLNNPAICGIEYQVPIDNYLNNSYLKLYEKTLLITCEITCTTRYFCQGLRYSQQLIYIMFYSILFVFGTNFLSNAITIGASIGFSTLLCTETFGEQRVWGTVGFGISAFVASRLYKVFGTDLVYIIMFSITTTICIIITSFIHIKSDKTKPKKTTNDNLENNEQENNNLSVKNGKKKKKKEKKDISQFKIAALIPLLKKIDVIIFLSLAFIWGMSYAALDPYVYLYIDEIGPCQSRSIIGWMSLIAAVSEILAFTLASRIIKLFGTNISSIIIFLAFAARFTGYYLIEKPYFILPVESMHFFNFGILYVLIAQKADAIAPPGLSGTLQGVVYGVSFGLGRGVGLIASSFIYTRLQSRLLFLVFALFNTIAAFVYSLVFIIHNRTSKKSMRSNNHTNIPKIVIDSEPNIVEEPLLISSSTNPTDKRISEQ